MLKIHGVPFSAHTRKVIVTAIEKGIAYEVKPVVPLTPPPGWSKLSPLGYIPAIEEDDGFSLADSSVICLYLERKHPQPSLYPQDPRDYARALWLEEYVDSGLQQHVLRGLLQQRVFAPKFLKKAPDEALIRSSLQEMIPPRLAYLEQSLTADFIAGNSFSIADITVASILLNYHYAGEKLDPAAHPRLQRYLARILVRDSFKKAFAAELPAAESIGALDLSLLRSLGY
jgi:glutathione S-transferase